MNPFIYRFKVRRDWGNPRRHAFQNRCWHSVIGRQRKKNIGDAEVFLQEEGQTYLNGFDASGTVAIDYGVRGIPEKYFIDRNGSLVKKLSGPLNETVLRNTINELLAR